MDHMTTTQGESPAFFTSPAQMKELARSSPGDLVSGLVPSGAVVVLAGAPGTGKSFVALSWAAAVAEGTRWFSHTVQQANVVYVLGEGWARFGHRIEAWEEASGQPMSDAVHFVNGLSHDIDFKDPHQVQRFIDEVMVISPGLIIVDTFSMLARVSNENDNAEVATVMANINAIVSATGATVMLIHHVTKTSHSVRGASAFVGNSDTVIMAAEDKDQDASKGSFLLSTEGALGGKQRDGKAKTIRGFKIASPGVLTNSRPQSPGLEEAKANALTAVAKAVATNENKEY